MAARKPTALELSLLLAFHASLSGAFLVAYLTGDEDTYGMHLFAGYTVVATILLRLVAGIVAPAGSPLRLPRPSVAPLRAWAGRLLAGDAAARRERSPLIPWMGLSLLAIVAAAAFSGVGADSLTSLEHLHEALGKAALWIVAAHLALVAALHWLKRLTPAVATIRA